MRRVVITGIGIIAPNGATTAEFWASCLEGKTTPAPIPEAWNRYCSYSSRIWAPLPQIDFSAWGISRIEQMQLDTTGALAIAAAAQALSEANFPAVLVDEKKARYCIGGLNAARTGVFVGTGAGGLTSLIGAQANHILSAVKSRMPNPDAQEHASVQELLTMPPRFNPFVVSMLMPNAPAGVLGIRYGLTGANQTCCCACASGTVAIGRAYEAIRLGIIDCALAGGVEFLGDDYGGIFRGFDAAKTLVQSRGDPLRANRPFDRDRSGFLFAEGGACILVLEEAGHAKARGAAPIAEPVSFAESFDAHNIMMIDPAATAIREMLMQALDRAGVRAVDIDYINAHGTGTLLNDDVESRSIAEMFGDRPLIAATKSIIGHTMGAAGAIEAAVTAMSIRDKITHRCVNLDNPVRPLNFVTATQRAAIRIGLTHSFAFGGHNAALVLREPA